MQIELCGGRFGVPSLTREDPVVTFDDLLSGFLEGHDDATHNLGAMQRAMTQTATRLIAWSRP